MENPDAGPHPVPVDSNPGPDKVPAQILNPNPNLEEGISTSPTLPDSVKAGHARATAPKKKTEFEREMELFEAAEREEEARLLAALRNPHQAKDGEIKNLNHAAARLKIKRNDVDRRKNFDEDSDYIARSSDSGQIRTPVTRLSHRSKRKRVTRNSSSNDSSGSDYEEEEHDDDEEEKENDDKDDEDDDNGIPRRGNQRNVRDFVGWASKELVSFLQQIGEDPEKALSVTAVKNILLNYIETNELTNPQRHAQVICDEKLHTLFQKKNILKYELMKLLSPHVASKKRGIAKVSKPSDDDDEDDDMELDDSEDKQHKHRKLKKNIIKEKEAKPGTKDYAAIDVKNINLIYLKRSLLDYLREDPDFETKVVGTFVRIRVPAMTNKNEACYRLVQVVGIKNVQGTQNAKVGDIILEIQNLQKREEVTLDAVSTHDFTEEECQRLRQSVKCGLLNAMTVGQLEEKARALREVKVKDWFENELVRLSHLRDRASENGRKKELRECVEKLQVLSSPAQRERQLKAPIDINVDPHMDPEYESDNADELLPNSIGNQSDCVTQKVGEKISPVEVSRNVVNRGNLVDLNHFTRINDQPIQKHFQKWVHEGNRGWGNGAINTENAAAHQMNFPRKDDTWGDGIEIDRREDAKWLGNPGGYKKAILDGKITEEQYRAGIRNAPKLEDNQKDDSWRGRGTEAEGTWGNHYVDDKINNEGNKRYDDWRFNPGRVDNGCINSGLNVGDGIKGENARRDECFDEYSKGDEWSRGRESDGRWGSSLFHEASNSRGIASRSDEASRSSAVGNTIEWHGAGGKESIDDMGRQTMIDYYGRKASFVGSVEPSDSWNSPNGGLLKREWTDLKHPYYQREVYAAMFSGRTTDLQDARMAVEGNAKIWHYHDPTGKSQGPFTMDQLREWEKTKLFPQDLRIWRSTETPEDGVLLTDLLQGRLRKEYVHPKLAENPRDFNDAAHIRHPMLAENPRDFNDAAHIRHPMLAENLRDFNDAANSRHPMLTENHRDFSDAPNSSRHPRLTENPRDFGDAPNSSRHPRPAENPRDFSDAPNSSRHPRIADNPRDFSDAPNSSRHPRLAENPRDFNDAPNSRHPRITENSRDFNDAPNSSSWDDDDDDDDDDVMHSGAKYWAVEKAHNSLLPHDAGGSRQDRGWSSSQGHSHYDSDKGDFDWEKDSIDHPRRHPRPHHHRHHHRPHRPHRPDRRYRHDFGRFPTSKKECPCRYFERGMCNKGQNCEFKH